MENNRYFPYITNCLGELYLQKKQASKALVLFAAVLQYEA